MQPKGCPCIGSSEAAPIPGRARLSEYLIIVALVAVAAIGVVTVFGRDIRELFSGTTDSLRATRHNTARKATVKSSKNLKNFGKYKPRPATEGASPAGVSGARGGRPGPPSCYLRTMGRDTKGPDKVVRSDEHNSRGIELADRGWLDEAVKEFKKAIELDPSSAHAHDNLATVYSEKKLYAQALEEY